MFILLYDIWESMQIMNVLFDMSTTFNTED